MKKSELREIIKEELNLLVEHKVKGNTVKDLIDLLKKFPSDWEIIYHGKGSPSDSHIVRGIQDEYEKKRGRNVLKLQDY